jgi:hypothetical protein
VAPDAVKVPDAPAQTVEEFTVTTGKRFTVTVEVPVPSQPLSVPVTVYVVVLAGLAVTVAPVVALNPVDGVQE